MQPVVTLLLVDGSQYTGSVVGQNDSNITLNADVIDGRTANLLAPVSVVVARPEILSCSMHYVGVSPVTIAGHLCAMALPPIHSGFQKASLSVGYTGSAQRDESVKGAVTFASYQGVDTTGSFRGKTNLVLTVSYDDKWKSTPLSSNVTQLYDGLLTQNIYHHRTPASNCSAEVNPFAYQFVGHAYHNNSQGIQVDQSYGFGLAKVLTFGRPAGKILPGCTRANMLNQRTIALSADVRSVNYALYPPGSSVHGVGTQLQASYSTTFLSRQVIVLQVGGVPVYNNLNMSAASGLFEYIIPFSTSWAVQFAVNDNYYEIAPKTFNKNYVSISIGLTFTPPKTGTVK